jgi:hypothetical protein
MNSLRPLILITPCIIPRLLWTYLKLTQVAKNHLAFATALLWH